MNPEIIKKLNDQPQKFCGNMLVNHNRDIFLLGMISGDTGETYVVTPAHAKGILAAFTQHIAVYEKQFGTIDTSQSATQSPLQMKDLGGSSGQK